MTEAAGSNGPKNGPNGHKNGPISEVVRAKLPSGKTHRIVAHRDPWRRGSLPAQATVEKREQRSSRLFRLTTILQNLRLFPGKPPSTARRPVCLRVWRPLFNRSHPPQPDPHHPTPRFRPPETPHHLAFVNRPTPVGFPIHLNQPALLLSRALRSHPWSRDAERYQECLSTERAAAVTRRRCPRRRPRQPTSFRASDSD